MRRRAKRKRDLGWLGEYKYIPGISKRSQRGWEKRRRYAGDMTRIEHGQHTEAKFARVWEKTAAYPQWISEVKKASEYQDKHGVDFVIVTDCGEIPLQIKSSDAGYKDHLIKNEKYGTYIPCVVITHYMNPKEIRQLTLEAIEPTYQRLRANKLVAKPEIGERQLAAA